jgi:hypothetical protein
MRVYPTRKIEGNTFRGETFAFPATCPWCFRGGAYLEKIDGVDRVKYLAAPRLTDDENFPVLTGLDKGFLQSLRIESW